MEREQVHKQGRLGGQVKRYHTWPVLHAQTVAEHTWQSMRIWYEIFGPIDRHITTYLLWHDAGEIVTGDLPFPVKSRNPAIKKPLDQLEEQAVTLMDGPPQHGYGLTDAEKIKAKVCDLIEMYEYGCHEAHLGNKYAEPIIKDTHAAVVELLKKMTIEDTEKVRGYVETIPVKGC